MNIGDVLKIRKATVITKNANGRVSIDINANGGNRRGKKVFHMVVIGMTDEDDEFDANAAFEAMGWKYVADTDEGVPIDD